MKAVIVTGDRHATEVEWGYAIDVALDEMRWGDLVIHGAARGIDTIASRIAEESGCKTHGFPADWSMGRRAGPLRNTAMLKRLMFLRDTQGADISVIAFHDDIEHSKGTKDMVRQARAAGVPVTIYCSDGRAT